MENIIYYNQYNRCSNWKQFELNVLCSKQAIRLNKDTSYKINSDI